MKWNANREVKVGLSVILILVVTLAAVATHRLMRSSVPAQTASASPDAPQEAAPQPVVPSTDAAPPTEAMPKPAMASRDGDYDAARSSTSFVKPASAHADGEEARSVSYATASVDDRYSLRREPGPAVPVAAPAPPASLEPAQPRPAATPSPRTRFDRRLRCG